MIGETITYLKDPHLVARIQQLFGIRIHYNDEGSKDARTDKLENEDCRTVGSKRNGYGVYAESNGRPVRDGVAQRKETNASSEDDDALPSDPESLDYTITNRLWYYLFLFGTELGDETFYSAFIPFWFWNIDGAVGRRVVLVWAIIMTIGKSDLYSFI